MRRTLSWVLAVAVLSTALISAPAFAVKKALFDNAHAETAGNADWQIDTDQPIPLPAQSGITPGSPGTYWTGAISSWAVALVKRGYTVETNTAALTYGNTSNPRDLANYDVLIVDEPNTLFSAAEATAIFAFLQNGGGLVGVADHNISDRNNDGQDSPRIWNALDPSHLLGVSFAITGNSNNNITQTSTNVRAVASDSITRGPVGNVTGLAFHAGTTMTLWPAANSSVRGEVWMNGLAQTSTTGVMCASAVYGNGRVVFVGDSSPADDGTAAPGNSNIFNGWGEAGATDSTLFLNATLWATRRDAAADATPPTVALTAPNGGETWKVGATQSVTWTASDNVGVTAVDLAYSTDGGATFPNTIATGLTNSGSYAWTIPAAPGTALRVRATARDAAGNSAADASNASFTIDRWTITASAGANGTISPSGAVAVNHGANQSFTITPNSGFTVSTVTVDGASVGATTSYTFTNVTANHTIAASFAANSGTGPWPMASGNYSESFADVANWTNNFASGAGATRWASVPVQTTGTIPNGVRTTVSTATFTTGTTGGVQKGVSPNPAGTIVLLTTGTTDNTSADAIDLRLDFTGVAAGTLSFDWQTVFNSTGDRKGSLRVYTSPNGTTFTELAAAAVLNFTNNVAGSGSRTAIALPAGLGGAAGARIRFYYHNGSGGTTGSRPKIAIDNVTVTGGGSLLVLDDSEDRGETPARLALALAPPTPNPSDGPTRLAFTLPEAGPARIEVLDLAGRRVAMESGSFAAGTHAWTWDGRGFDRSRVLAGVYFARLVTDQGVRTRRLVRF